MRPERHPPAGLGPAAAGQHPAHGGLEVVVANLDQPDPAEPPERVHVSFQERLLTLGQRRPVHCPARVRQPHREQRGLRLHPAQHHPQVVEVHLSLGRRRMGLRHAPGLQRPARLRGDLRPPSRDIIPHRRIRQIGRAVLIDQPGRHPARGMPLLPRRLQVTAQHLIDRRLERLQPRRAAHRRLARRRHRARQRLPHRPPVHMMPVRQLPDRAALHPPVTPDRSEQLHPRPQSRPLP